MSTSIITAVETFSLSSDMVLLGEGPAARRARVRASEAMRKQILSAKDLLEAAWQGDPVARLRVNEAITTSDLFKSATGEVVDRMLLADYEREEPTWQAFAAPTTVKDFKPKTLAELTRNTRGFARVPERSDYPIANTTAAERTIKVNKFGEAFGYTLEARINDELGELQQVPSGWAYQARVTESDVALEQMVNVITGAPNTAFFNVPNDNIGTGALNETNLQAAIVKLTTKKDKDGKLLRAPQLQLVVGPALQFAAERIMNAAELRIVTGSTTSIQPNPFKGKVKLTVLADLPGAAWFVLPVPQAGRKNAFYVAKLLGFETPDTRYKADQGQRMGGGSIGVDEGSFDNDTVWFRCRHIVGGASGDPTFTWASDGLGA